MSVKATSNNGMHKSGDNYSEKTEKLDLESSKKTAKIFKEEVSKPSIEPKTTKKEYYISLIMSEKGVTRDVAEAEYEFFGF